MTDRFQAQVVGAEKPQKVGLSELRATEWDGEKREVYDHFVAENCRTLDSRFRDCGKDNPPAEDGTRTGYIRTDNQGYILAVYSGLADGDQSDFPLIEVTFNSPMEGTESGRGTIVTVPAGFELLPLDIVEGTFERFFEARGESFKVVVPELDQGGLDDDLLGLVAAAFSGEAKLSANDSRVITAPTTGQQVVHIDLDDGNTHAILLSLRGEETKLRILPVDEFNRQRWAAEMSGISDERVKYVLVNGADLNCFKSLRVSQSLILGGEVAQGSVGRLQLPSALPRVATLNLAETGVLAVDVEAAAFLKFESR